MKLVLIGDGESPHLLKWARALAPRVDLWAASSRGFLPGFDEVLPAPRRLALQTRPRFEGGNAALLATLPRLVPWLRAIRPDWLHAHYLTSHGTLAWLARGLGVPGRLVGSAWGSDILVAPQASAPLRWLTRRVLRACALSTSDSQHMAGRMRALGAREVMVFPFGLERMPPEGGMPGDLPAKDEDAFFANRGLEPIYAPHRVIDTFARIAAVWPRARLTVAHDGSLRPALEAEVRARGLAGRVHFTGRLDPAAQAAEYARARWYLSLPESDSVSVSVLEALAYGCVPLLSDLPANRELVDSGRNGLILAAGPGASGAPAPAGLPAAPDALHAANLAALQALRPRVDEIAAANRTWVAAHAMFPAAVDRFVARLAQIDGSDRSGGAASAAPSAAAAPSPPGPLA